MFHWRFFLKKRVVMVLVTLAGLRVRGAGKEKPGRLGAGPVQGGRDEVSKKWRLAFEVDQFAEEFVDGGDNL